MINTFFKEFELLPMSHGLWDRFATVCGIAPSQTVADFFMYNFINTGTDFLLPL